MSAIIFSMHTTKEYANFDSWVMEAIEIEKNGMWERERGELEMIFHFMNSAKRRLKKV